tara:strand:+ start:1910 stop:4111 length:2202 start_codon:yes stop_codon:yes gene_type:complete
MNIMSFGKSPRDVAERISKEVPRSIQLQTLIDTYPQGVQRGKEFYIGSLRGEAGRSMVINIDQSSPWFLTGKDFESGDGIGGICKVLKEGRGYTLKECFDLFEVYVQPDYVAPPDNIVKPNNPSNFAVTTAQSGFSKPEQKKNINPSTDFEDEYNYTDENGVVIVSVRKYFERDLTGEIIRDDLGKPKKQFRQFMEGRQGIPEPRPLYNIPNILGSDKVIWVEGEKCADALNAIGYNATCTIGGAGMLSENTSHKFDFSPMKGKNVILWPDNDDAGKKLAALVEKNVKLAGAKTVMMLKIPSTKPEKWDAADAIDEEFNITKMLRKNERSVKKPINLLDESLLINEYFVGSAPTQSFLIGDTIPLGVPCVFAAAGDSGKGMMTLDLAMKVASGTSMQSAFGGLVAQHGDVILITAEDDKDEMHRRIARLDPKKSRETYSHKLRILPLPNLGGVFPIMQKFDNTYLMGDEFSRIYDQMLEMETLKLIVIDPMASFVHADVNADPAAGAAFMSLLAQMATETGATVMVNHHMAKIKDNDPVKTPEQARNLIRGTSAIVDGVRSAFAVWSVDESTGKQRCRDLEIEYTRNGVFDGAVVKSNGPANRDIRHFIRNPNTGLLEDRSVDIRSLVMSHSVRQRMIHIVDFVRMRENEGRAVTHGGAHDGIYRSIHESNSQEPCAVYLKTAGLETTIKNAVTKACADGLMRKYSMTSSGSERWLGTIDGPMSRGEYERDTV